MSGAIVALWSHPRSMSTAFERVMRARGDMKCLHEPFMYDYYINRAKRAMPHFEVQEGHPRTYEAIRDMIVEDARSGPVFFKDMSYYVMPHMLEDKAFLDRVTHSFLVRDLKAAIVSYAKLDSEVTSEEIGIEAQWLHFNALKERTGKTPVVVRSENVQADPKGQMSRYFAAVGLPDKPEALEWDDAAPQDWQQVSGWHKDVMASSTIRPVSADADAAVEKSFAKLLAEQPRFGAIYAHHAPFHARLLAYAS